MIEIDPSGQPKLAGEQLGNSGPQYLSAYIRRVSDDHFDAVRRLTLEQEVATGMVLIRRTVVDQIGRDHPMRNVTKYPHDSVKTAGKLLDPAYLKRTDKFLKELVWMAKVLRYGRENVPRE